MTVELEVWVYEGDEGERKATDVMMAANTENVAALLLFTTVKNKAG